MSGFHRRALLKGAGLAAMAGALGVHWTAVGTSIEKAWTLESAERAIPGSAVTETVWRAIGAPYGERDIIRIHRYRQPGASIAALLYLPGTNMNGSLAATDEAHNLWLYLAARGIEVFAVDYRTHAVAPDSDPAAFAFMKAWTMQAFVDDARTAAAVARHESGRAKLFVAGFSRGGALAYALAGAEPDAVAGLVILDGSFKSASPKPFDLAKGTAEFEAAGKWFTSIDGRRGYEARQALMAAVIANPDTPATDSRFKTVGEQLTYVLQNSWGPGGLANPAGGISKPQVLARLMHDYDRYYPAIQDVEGKAIAAEADAPATALDDRWGEMTTPVLAFASTNMGPDWIANIAYSATRSGASDVTVIRLKDYGHLDVLVAETAAAQVFEPTFAWIKAHVG